MKSKKTKPSIPDLGKSKFPSVEELLNKYFESIDTAQAQDEQFFKTYYKWLEDERERRIDEILDSLTEFATLEVTKTFNRIVDMKYVHDPLCVAGSVSEMGGRFNIGNGISHYKPFHALYIADSDNTAYCEKFHYPRTYTKNNLESLDFSLRKNYACFEVEVSLNKCLDISDKQNLREFCRVISEVKPPKELITLARSVNILQLKTIQSPGELLNSLLSPTYLNLPTALDMPSNSQWFSLYCLRAGIQGIAYPSVRTDRQGQNIAILVDNLAETESYAQLNAETEVIDDSRRTLDQSTVHFFKVPFSRKNTH